MNGFDGLLDNESVNGVTGTGVPISLHQNAMYRNTSEILLGCIKDSQMLMKSEEGALILRAAEAIYDRHQDLMEQQDLSSEEFFRSMLDSMFEIIHRVVGDEPLRDAFRHKLQNSVNLEMNYLNRRLNKMMGQVSCSNVDRSMKNMAAFND
jgi:hypothetical protein